LTIERKDLEFILSHFEPPVLPRRISTALSQDKQYAVYSVDFMLMKFKEAKELDCKVNAYRYIGQDKICAEQPSNDNGHGGDEHGASSASTYDYSTNVNMSRESATKQIQQRAEVEAAPTLIHIDLDRKNFSSDRTHRNAVSKTVAKIHEVFLIPPSSDDDASPVTTYWSGGGCHILLPLDVDPAKYPVKNSMTLAQTVPGRDLHYASLFTGGNDYRFSAGHTLPANLFLWFAEDYLTDRKGDSGHHPSVRSSMVRVPGSYNSKYVDKEKAEVKILQHWDGHTKAHILFLLGAFYRNVRNDYRKQARMQAQAHKVKQKMQAAQIALERTIDVVPVSGPIANQVFGEGAYSIYAHNKYWYIDNLLQTPVEDFRKRGIDLLITPYLITIKGMSYDVAKRIMLNWLLQCDNLRRLDFDAEYRVRSKIIDVKSTGFLPLGVEKFKAQDSNLVYRLAVAAESRKVSKSKIVQMPL
jgi:hypothetical protein